MLGSFCHSRIPVFVGSGTDSEEKLARLPRKSNLYVPSSELVGNLVLSCRYSLFYCTGMHERQWYYICTTSRNSYCRNVLIDSCKNPTRCRNSYYPRHFCWSQTSRWGH
eukprot:2111088-Rhodomonas_salina.1